MHRSSNCSLDHIPLTSPDAQLLESSHTRIKHAKELLDTDPSQFMYSGEVSVFPALGTLKLADINGCKLAGTRAGKLPTLMIREK